MASRLTSLCPNYVGNGPSLVHWDIENVSLCWAQSSYHWYCYSVAHIAIVDLHFTVWIPV